MAPYSQLPLKFFYTVFFLLALPFAGLGLGGVAFGLVLDGITWWCGWRKHPVLVSAEAPRRRTVVEGFGLTFMAIAGAMGFAREWVFDGCRSSCQWVALAKRTALADSGALQSIAVYLPKLGVPEMVPPVEAMVVVHFLLIGVALVGMALITRRIRWEAEGSDRIVGAAVIMSLIAIAMFCLYLFFDDPIKFYQWGGASIVSRELYIHLASGVGVVLALLIANYGLCAALARGGQ